HRRRFTGMYVGIVKNDFKRLARRGGVKRTSSIMYEEMRAGLKIFLEGVVRDAVVYTEHGRRATLTSADVVHALRRSGKTFYGFGI
ncbi:histone H4, partial [Mycena epipterygia]